MITSPLVASSRPARMLRIVDLPQPECPMMQTNSPLSIAKLTSENTVNGASPRAPAKTFDSPSTLRKSFCTLFLVGDEPCEPAKHKIEQHANDTYRQNREDHIGERQIVPLVPHEVPDARAAHKHLRGHNNQPCDAHGDAHAGQYRRSCRRQND